MMIEQKVIEYLINAQIEGVGNHVYAEKQENPEDEYIIVQKTGSGYQDKVNRAMIAVQSISKNRRSRAAKINEMVKDLMELIIDGDNELYSCKRISDYDFTDTTTKEYRYQAVFNLYY